MKLKLIMVVLVSATCIMANGQPEYPLTKWDLLQLYYQYMAAHPEYSYPATKQESVTDDYLGAKVKEHHVQQGVNYSEVMCIADSNDPQVIHRQQGKSAEKLQPPAASGKPALLIVNYNSGLFAGDKRITNKYFADGISLGEWQCGQPELQQNSPAENWSDIDKELYKLLFHEY